LRSGARPRGVRQERTRQIDDDELDEFRRLARGYFEMNARQLAALIEDNELLEVTDEEGS